MSSEAQPEGVLVSHAMLSIYYQTVGRQFEVRGAPSVFLPPEIQPMSLEDALGVLQRNEPSRLREALWRIVRGVPAIQNPSRQGPGGFGAAQSYPRAMLPYLNGKPLQHLIDRRREYRLYANLFSAALISCRDGADPVIFSKLIDLLDSRGETGFSLAASRVLGAELMQRLRMNDQNKIYLDRLGNQVARIENEIGCSIQEFVEGIADAAAFDQVMIDDMQPSIPLAGLRNGLGVYPICSVIKQDTQNMVTSATSTTVVGGTFEQICDVINPANWAQSGSIIDKANFVDHPFDLVTVDPAEFGNGQPALLREWAQISWSEDPDQQAKFQNILNVVSSIRDSPDEADRSEGSNGEFRTAEVRYNLCRSIDSTVLWDTRTGGLLVDQGFIKVRPLGAEKWQVTIRKEVEFSDRTPYAGGRGWQDFGQLANYLAPATLTCWLECETYRIGTTTPVTATGVNNERSA